MYIFSRNIAVDIAKIFEKALADSDVKVLNASEDKTYNEILDKIEDVLYDAFDHYNFHDDEILQGIIGESYWQY